jgi:murein DD-endopeptidase MepM/ murein hydrolase activator NlpD
MRSGVLFIAVAGLLIVMACPTQALAQKRFALLIGNQSYSAEVGPLKNPHNDIEIIAKALRQVGFEVLPLMKDARRSTMLGGVRALAAKLDAAGTGAVGFLYYSGHGAAEAATGFNYLIPTDARNVDTAEFWDESLKLDEILKLLDTAKQAAHFVVFDACRNELNLPQRSTSKGFIPVSDQAGMFIAYAAAPGRAASDRGERSGPYAAALAAEIVKPAQHHLDLFQNVKEAVANASGGRQEPWERNGLRRRVYFADDPGGNGPVASRLQDAKAAELWEVVANTSKPAVVETFIELFGDSSYAPRARAKLERLKIAAAAPKSDGQGGWTATIAKPGGCAMSVFDGLRGLRLDRPLPGRIVSGFGFRRRPGTNEEALHTGVDFGVSLGEPVKAAAIGRVSSAGEQGGYGKTVTIEHGDGMVSRYAQLDKIDVRENDCVARGAVIGRAGKSRLENVEANLHFELLWYSRFVDPAPLIEGERP